MERVSAAFDKNGKPLGMIEKLGNEIEEQVRELMMKLIKNGYSATDIRAAGGYLAGHADIATSYAILELQRLDREEQIRNADPNLNDNEQDLARQNQKILSIKAYRERTGRGLKEAKDAVEDWMKNNL